MDLEVLVLFTHAVGNIYPSRREDSPFLVQVMPQPLSRAATATLQRRLESFPVVAVIGARQTGKSTLVKAIGGPQARYVTMDAVQNLNLAHRSPGELLRQSPRMIIDEVQRAPDLLLAIKQEVDERRAPGRFLLTGSANLLLMHRISESLAGRAAYLTLWPLTRREKLGLGAPGQWSLFFSRPWSDWPNALPPNPLPGDDWRQLAIDGGFPDPGFHLRGNSAAQADWFDGYVQTYLERDLRDLTAVHDLGAFQRLMRAAALRLGGLLNLSDLARDVGLPVSTAQRFLDLLVLSYQVVLLEPYSVNRTKRLVKRPKLYWSDAALALHVAGDLQPGGAHLENLMLHDLLVWKELQIGRPQILYWRTQKGAEVDFVVEWQNRVLPIEIKSSRTVGYADTQHLRTFLAEYPDVATAALIVYDGDEVYWAADRVLAVPWGRVL